MRLVDPDGGQVGIKTIEEALWLAEQLDLDLVEVAPDARPPVCRLMDYGKFKYEQSVKAREARKKQSRTVIKEVQFRPKISSNDFNVKRRRVERFLSEGDKVKVTMRFRGREVTHPEIGREILERLVAQVSELGVIEAHPKLEGRQITMVLGPTGKTLEDLEEEKAEQAEPEVAAVPDEPAAEPESSAAPEGDDETAA